MIVICGLVVVALHVMSLIVSLLVGDDHGIPVDEHEFPVKENDFCYIWADNSKLVFV